MSYDIVAQAQGIFTDIEDLIRDNREMRKLTTWQTIETAPKDGTPVLLWGSAYSRLYPKRTWFTGRWDRGWWGLGDTKHTINDCTYWMPLQKPPTE